MIRPLKWWATMISIALTAAACGSDPRTFTVAVDAELSGEAPFGVQSSGEIRLDRGGTAEGAIVFEATEAVVLDDIRWTFSAVRGDALFVTAGHGCGPSIDPGSDRIQFACTEDYRYLAVEPGKPLTETITLYGGLEGGPVATGLFVFRQPITWWRASGNPLDPRGEKGGEVVVTLTYTIRTR